MSSVVLQGLVTNIVRGQAWSLGDHFPETRTRSVCLSRACGLFWASLWDARTQGRTLEFTTIINLAFQKMGELLAVGGQPRHQRGGLPILCESLLTLGFKFWAVQCTVSDVESAAFPKPVSVLMSKWSTSIFPVETASHLLPVQTISGDWPYILLTWKMGVWSLSSQSQLQSSACCS